MKVKNLFLVTLVAVLFTTHTSATVLSTPLSDGKNVNFSTVGKMLKISVRNIKTEKVSIYMEDTEGVSLVNETIESKPNFVKAYHLDNLPEGKYKFTVKRNGIKVVQPFEVTAVGINISASDRDETLLPSLTQKGAEVFVSSFVKKGGSTTVRVMGSDGVLMLEKKYSDEILHKTFDLSKLPTDVYYFELQTEDETEYFTVVR